MTPSLLQGYNQYNFPEALWQIEKSTQILENLLNSKHVFIAASWRLKALLLEGLAANTDNEQVCGGYTMQPQETTNTRTDFFKVLLPASLTLSEVLIQFKTLIN